MESSGFWKQVVVQTLFLSILLAGVWVLPGLKEKAKARDQTHDRGADPTPGHGRRQMGGGRGMMGGMMGRRKAPAGLASVPVVVAEVARKPIEAFFLSTCTLEARREVDVLAKISEKVVELGVEEGDRVEAGAVLAKLDDTEAKLREKESAVKLTNTKVVFERTERMLRQKVVSQEQFDSARLNFETAKVQSESAELDLSYTMIRSPIDGVVVARNVDTGQTVKVNEVLFKIADYNPIWGRIHVPERDLLKIRKGLPVQVAVESLSNRKFTGEVTMVSPVVDKDSGTVKVTFEVANPEGCGLRPGMFASTHLITETHENALVVPKKALAIESDVNEVFVVKPFLAAKIFSDYAAKVRPGAKAELVPAGTTGREGKGKGPGPAVIRCAVHSVSEPAEDEEEAECLFSLPDSHELKDNAKLKAKVQMSAADPSSANEGKSLTVSLSNPQIRYQARRRRVDLGFSEGNEAEILRGLELGERVVTVGNEDLKDDAVVTVVGTEAAGSVQVVKTKPSAPTRPSTGMGGPGALAAMRKRILADAKVKAEYEARLKKDPKLATDPQKFFEFLREMREKGLLKRRGMGPGAGRGHPGAMPPHP